MGRGWTSISGHTTSRSLGFKFGQSVGQEEESEVIVRIGLRKLGSRSLGGKKKTHQLVFFQFSAATCPLLIHIHQVHGCA